MPGFSLASKAFETLIKLQNYYQRGREFQVPASLLITVVVKAYLTPVNCSFTLRASHFTLGTGRASLSRGIT